MYKDNLVVLKLDNWVKAQLARPFPREEVKFLPGFGSSGVIAYVDARSVMNRLNEVVGAENWHDYYNEASLVQTETRDITPYPDLAEDGKASKNQWGKYSTDEHLKAFDHAAITYAGIKCSLTVLDITKCDVGTASMSEKIKGAFSDAFKRAAVKFGVGEYLYELGSLPARVERGRVVEEPELPDWALPVETDPDTPIKALIERVKGIELTGVDLLLRDEALDRITAMGVYNSTSPLVVKRHVYEVLKRIIDGQESR